MSARRHSHSKGATNSKRLRRPKLLKHLKGPKRSGPGGKAPGLMWRRGTAGTRAKTTPPLKSRQRPTSALTRRNRIPLALAAVFSLAILGTSFPASALLAQHRQLSAASGQLERAAEGESVAGRAAAAIELQSRHRSSGSTGLSIGAAGPDAL